MRVGKIKGKKRCNYCGNSFGYVNIRKNFCSNICSTRYRRQHQNIDKNRPISLAFIPEHLIEKEQ